MALSDLSSTIFAFVVLLGQEVYLCSPSIPTYDSLSLRYQREANFRRLPK
jgi:hypothetical protein